MSKIDTISYDMALENRMYQSKQDCLEALASIVHPKYIERFANVLAYAFDQDDADAFSIANDLKLDHLNFLAVLDLSKQFEDKLWEQGEKDYLDSMEFEELAL